MCATPTPPWTRASSGPGTWPQRSSCWQRFDSIVDVLRPTETEPGLSDDEVEAKFRSATQAKKAKNFALADQIREELLEAGIILEDTKDGVRWKRK